MQMEKKRGKLVLEPFSCGEATEHSYANAKMTSYADMQGRQLSGADYRLLGQQLWLLLPLKTWLACASFPGHDRI